jgi:hypothetical protein
MAASGDHQIELALATPEGAAAVRSATSAAASRRRVPKSQPVDAIETVASLTAQAPPGRGTLRHRTYRTTGSRIRRERIDGQH